MIERTRRKFDEARPGLTSQSSVLSESAGNNPHPNDNCEPSRGGDGQWLTSVRPKYSAIGETLNAIARLLATELTDLERQYLHKRIAEEHVQLERLEKSQPEQQAEVIAAAETLGKHTGGQSHV
jgi:hypothetical protein